MGLYGIYGEHTQEACPLYNEKSRKFLLNTVPYTYIHPGFETKADRLKPLRTISTEIMDSEVTENVLIPESLKSKLKVIGTFLGATIPIVVSIITLYLTLIRH